MKAWLAGIIASALKSLFIDLFVWIGKQISTAYRAVVRKLKSQKAEKEFMKSGSDPKTPEAERLKEKENAWDKYLDSTNPDRKP